MRRRRVLKRLEAPGDPVTGLSRPGDRTSNLVKCSFCGKSQQQVIRLIAGPGVYICNECVQLCAEAMDAREEPVHEITGPQPVNGSAWLIEVRARTGDAAAKDAILREINRWPGQVEIHVREIEDDDTDQT